MMTSTTKKISVVKLVLETTSPMATYTGHRETLFDNQLVRDVNGLPMLPSTSFVGVWRHLADQQGLDTKSLFGTTEGDSQASRLSVSSGRMLNSQSLAVSNYIDDSELEQDPLLRLCKMERPLYRDRVSINDRGVAKDTGKFDQVLLPKGVRFTLNIQARGLCDKGLTAALSLLNDRRFALGASTRNGLGQVQVVYSEKVTIDLESNPKAGDQLRSALSKPCNQTNELNKPEYSQSTKTLLARIPLQALDNWRCGKGSELLGDEPKEGSVGIITYSEQSVVWNGNKAIVDNRKPVLCGSSVKGMLAHRLAYHYRRHAGVWAEDMAQATHEQWETRPEALSELLGKADDNQAMVGRLIVLDSEIDYEDTVIRTHNAIDRFTGGVRQSALYSEELLYQPKFTLELHLTPGNPISETMTKALKDTVKDIKAGLLPIGAGSGRGTSMVLPQVGQDMVFNEALLAGDV